MQFGVAVCVHLNFNSFESIVGVVTWCYHCPSQASWLSLTSVKHLPLIIFIMQVWFYSANCQAIYNPLRGAVLICIMLVGQFTRCPTQRHFVEFRVFYLKVISKVMVTPHKGK